MDALSETQLSGQAVDHLGLVASMIDDLDLMTLIDARLPVQARSGAKTSMGERVAAMILNGLGFVDTRLYMFPDFLEKKPIKRLFGKSLEASWFNDDALGRCLDSISAYGTTKLFTELSFHIGKKKGLLGHSAHFDTTTLQLSGEFSQDLLKDQGPKPAQGYSKSKRHDLKQMVLNLATTGKSHFPVWMESHSGNASDQKVLPASAKRMSELCQQLSGVDDFIYVGDSAMYSNVLSLSNDIKWLSRVPERISEAARLVSLPEADLTWHSLSEGYYYTPFTSNYAEVQQRWIMVYSEQAYHREVKTLKRKIEKEKTELEKLWWHLGNQIFSCNEDAHLAAQKLSKKMKYHQISYSVSAVTGYKSSGRPKKDTLPETIGYKVDFVLSEDEEKSTTARRKKGRFILATNELDGDVLADADVLKEYKAQSGTESGFKFIKDDTFELDSVFLKTPSRIDALMMVMTLCLMVYGVSQYTLRESLRKADKTLPDQKKKPTQRPSMKWIYFLFSGVHELTIDLGGKMQQVVINVNPLLKEIVGHFGGRAQDIYLNSE